MQCHCLTDWTYSSSSLQMGMRKYLWTMVVAMFNMTVVTLATQYIIWHVLAKRRMQFHPSEMPNVWKALLDITLCIIITDILFYYLHRYLMSNSYMLLQQQL